MACVVLLTAVFVCVLALFRCLCIASVVYCVMLYGVLVVSLLWLCAFVDYTVCAVCVCVLVWCCLVCVVLCCVRVYDFMFDVLCDVAVLVFVIKHVFVCFCV